jgi:hypothetical protein
MKTTVSTEVEKGIRIVLMDDKIYELRKKVWNTIFKEKGDLSDCDVAMALGLVQYELIHHTKA